LENKYVLSSDSIITADYLSDEDILEISCFIDIDIPAQAVFVVYFKTVVFTD
jgi:hypothetical protein